jgi:hypothetical protein
MFNKTPSYLWQKKPSGAWYLKLPIPPELQHHYLNGKRKTLTHIVKPLGTAKEAEAEAFKRPLLAHYWTEFERLRRGAAAAKPDATEAAFLRARRLREAAQEVAARPDSESKDDAALAVQDMAQDLAEGLEPTIGLEAAQHLYALSTTPGLTLTEALAEWNADDTVRESTKAKRALAVRELLDFLRLRDCAVRDQKNWSCELGDTPAPAAGPPPLEWSMVDGRFIDASMLPGMQPIFYQVPKWKYYLIWLRQKG